MAAATGMTAAVPVSRKIFASYCVAVLAFFMVSIFARALTRNVLVEKFYMDNGFTRLVFFDMPRQKAFPVVDWAELYPFEKDEAVSGASSSIGERFKGRALLLEKKIEQYTSKNLVNRMMFVEMAVRGEMLLGWKLHETVVDLVNGFITETVEETETSRFAKAVASFYQFHETLQGLGVDLLYVQSPHKICRDDVLPVSDYSNANADAFLAALKEKNIPTLDLRQNIHDERLEHHELFYKTDHHWNAETGLWAAGVVAARLNEDFGFSIDTALFSPDKYRYDVYENWFLGSLGKKVTLIKAAPENIGLIHPMFDTDFSFKVPSRNIDIRGGFDIFYDYEQINKIDYYRLNPYAAYLYGDHPALAISNNLMPEGKKGKKLLIIKDSFVNSCAPFLACGVKQIDMLDLRHFTGSTLSYIRQSRPDMVVVMYDPAVLDFAVNDEKHWRMSEFR